MYFLFYSTFNPLNNLKYVHFIFNHYIYSKNIKNVLWILIYSMYTHLKDY